MKVTWHTYESAVSALGLQTITFDSSIVLGNDDASGTGQHTLHSWLINEHQQPLASFDSFFTDRRSAEQNRAAPGLYANVEAAKVAYKKDKRVLIKRWFLDEVKKHFGIFEHFPPSRDKCFHFVKIYFTLLAVRFPLVPDRPADTEWCDPMNHSVVDSGCALHTAEVWRRWRTSRVFARLHFFCGLARPPFHLRQVAVVPRFTLRCA